MSVILPKEEVLNQLWENAPAHVARMVERLVSDEYERGYQEGWTAHENWSSL